MRPWPWIFVAVCWLVTTHAILQTTQGTYEDSAYVRAMTGTPSPSLLSRRGLSRWTLWYQINHDLTPQHIRSWNVRIGLLVALAVGLLAAQLGVSAWAATALMIVHPLGVEALATMTGRMEVIGALGALLACLSVTTAHPLRWLGLLAGLMLAASGKEAALFAMVPALLIAQRPRVAIMAGIGLLAIVAWQSRAFVFVNAVPSRLDWALVQASAGWRLLTMTILPVRQTVDFDYDALPMIWRVAASASLVSVGVLAWAVRRTPILAGALLWALCVIGPRLIMETPKSYFNEHQAYLLLPAVALGFAWAVTQAETWAACSTA